MNAALHWSGPVVIGGALAFGLGVVIYPSVNAPTQEHPLVFALGIALTLGLLLTGIATFQADVFPRPAAGLQGILNRVFAARLFRPVYEDELRRLEDHAKAHRSILS
jgi:hypothetical protein